VRRCEAIRLVERPQNCHCEESEGRRSNLEVVVRHTSRLLHPRKRGIRNDWRAAFSTTTIITVCFLILILIPQSVYPCTAFCLDQGDQLLVGKNYDWNIDNGLVIINKHDVSKTAATNDNPASWVSKYGSVTFNQYGREMPNGGINEAGLVIEVLWLSTTEYPLPDNRPSLGNLQWIQYQLDNFSSVEEVIASDQVIRIVPDSDVKVHYFVCDSSGACATIEFLNGKLVYHTGETMPIKAISNNTYVQSMEFAKQFEGFGGKSPIGKRDRSVDPWSGSGSLDRFLYAAVMLEKYNSVNPKSTVDYMYKTLSAADSGNRTQWSIVYDIRMRKIYFKTVSRPEIKSIDLKDFDFDCESPVMVLDINSKLSGDVTAKFEPYAQKINRQLLEKSFSNTGFLKGLSPEVLDQISAYPDKTTCSKK
jgi:penicillin V acylase-like amidase (Ntn superfamily)